MTSILTLTASAKFWGNRSTSWILRRLADARLGRIEKHFFFLLEWVPWKTCPYAHTWTYSNNYYLGWNLVFPHRPQSSKILPKIWRFVRGGPIFSIDLNIMWVYPNFINFASNYYISNFKAIRQYLTFPHVPPFLLK